MRPSMKISDTAASALSSGPPSVGCAEVRPVGCPHRCHDTLAIAVRSSMKPRARSGASARGRGGAGVLVACEGAPTGGRDEPATCDGAPVGGGGGGEDEDSH